MKKRIFSLLLVCAMLLSLLPTMAFAEGTLPVATVTEIPKEQIKTTVDEFSNGGVPVCDFSNGLNRSPLYQTYPDCLYVFAADQTDTENAYNDWYTDFVVSFDKDVAKDSMGLGGYYASFGAALGFLAPQMVPANYKVPLLNFMTKRPNWTYAMIRDVVQVFPCGWKCQEMCSREIPKI